MISFDGKEHHNCDDCKKNDVCVYKEKAIEIEDKYKNDPDKPDILEIIVRCRKFYGYHTKNTTLRETQKKLS